MNKQASKTQRRRGVIILEFAAILVLVAVVAFVGLDYVSRHQKLASGQQVVPVPVQNSVSSNDVKPITNEASMDDVVKQMTDLETELGSDTCAYALLSEIDSINK